MFDPGNIICIITGLILGVSIGAEIQRRVTARKRDELEYFMSPVVPHDPQEAVRRAG
jgi:hypothetical protein